MLIRIQRKFDKEITVVDIQMKDLNEQIKIFELEKARLCQQMNSIKEATKSDANSFEERLKVVLIQSEKNKEEMYKQKEQKLSKENYKEQVARKKSVADPYAMRLLNKQNVFSTGKYKWHESLWK